MAMNVTFYILLGFLVGVAIMCAMVIVVSVSDQTRPHRNESSSNNSGQDDKSDKVVYQKDHKDLYTYDAKGRKRKVVNLRYRDR